VPTVAVVGNFLSSGHALAWPAGDSMGAQLVGDDAIGSTVRAMGVRAFTVLDFIDAFSRLHPKDWHRLVERFGRYGEGRRYKATTYLSNRLDLYSQRPSSLLRPLTRYSVDRSRDYRRPTPEEGARFGSPWIAVFKVRSKRPGRKGRARTQRGQASGPSARASL